jgi:hypothetical protein
MEPQMLRAVRARLGDGPVPFEYTRGEFAAILLRHAVDGEPRVNLLRRTRWGRLLDRPAIRARLARRGDGRLRRADLRRIRDDTTQRYDLTFGEWGVAGKRSDWWWTQTSRPGLDLVVQLNFDVGHDAAYDALLGSPDDCPFADGGHPTHSVRHTLGWSRVDLDLDAGEALVEEVQSDWIREVDDYVDCLQNCTCERVCRAWAWRGAMPPTDQVVTYARELVAPHRKLWAEAILAATVDLLVGRLGIRRIWYHTWDGGRLMKRCGDAPRSLYTDLPRRFCFQETADAPPFMEGTVRLRQARRRRPVRWHLLDLGDVVPAGGDAPLDAQGRIRARSPLRR